ncbi:MAG: ArnT family glycosyltransferase [Myxococcota bacterium]
MSVLTPRSDRRIAFLLGASYVALLYFTAPAVGYARDEGFYFVSANAYREWFALLFSEPLRALSRGEVERYWSVNHEHPSLMKVLFCASHELFHSKLRWMPPGVSYRFPSMLIAGGAVALLHHTAARSYGRLAGLVAALAFAFMPRVFFHAHLACFDVPVAALWLLCGYAYLRSLEGQREPSGSTWAYRTAICYALLLDTKHNAWLFPAIPVAHQLLMRLGDHIADRKRGRPYVPKVFFTTALLAPVLFYALWPWLWYDPWHKLLEYVRFHTQHEYYNMEFLGQTYWKPPMPAGYAWLMTLATVPTTTLLLALLGVGAWFFARTPGAPAPAAPSPAPPEPVVPARRALTTSSVRTGRAPLAPRSPLPAPARSPVPAAPPPKPSASEALPAAILASPELFWILAVLVSYAPWWSQSTPIFGGTKHWLTAYPFLALLAGRGFQLLAEHLAEFAREKKFTKFSLPLLGAACVSAVSVVMALRVHPFGLSAYTPLVGGAPGAATLGLNRTFWGYTTASLADFINERAAQDASVYVHDTALPSWEMLRADGRLREDLRASLSITGSSLALYHHEPHMGRVEYQIWVDYGTSVPAAMLTHDGVPVTWIYDREAP